MCPLKVFLVGNYLRFLHLVLSFRYGVSCSMTGPLHCQGRQLCNYKPADRAVAFGNFFPEKCFLLMQCSIIFSPKYGHQHIRKCTLYQKRDENTDWCLRGSMQFIHLWSLGNVSSAGGKKSKNVAWKAWKPHLHASCPAATLPYHKAEITRLLSQICAEWCWDP